MTSPQVSIIMPVYNGASFVTDALNSVFSQTLDDFELIVVDDGSTDETSAILQRCHDPRLRLITHSTNLGGAAARNKGISVARGRYIAQIDVDDRAHPKRLERQVAFLDQNPDLDLIGSWSRMMDEAGQPLPRIRRQPLTPDAVRARLLFRCCISHRSVIARREVYDLYKYDPDFRLSQDFELFVRMTKSFKLGNLPDVLMFARVHRQQISRNKANVAKIKNIDIIRRQLVDLNVPFSDADLERHFFLTRPKLLGDDLNTSYMEWAADWLVGLQSANQRVRHYNPSALRTVCREIWFALCRRAVRQHRWTMCRYFVRSPFLD